MLARLDELAAVQPSVFPEGEVATAAKTGLGRATKIRDRAVAGALVPEVGAALAAGATTGDRVDVLARATAGLNARWACLGSVTPVVVAADGQRIVLGREIRLANRAQRRALREGGWRLHLAPDRTLTVTASDGTVHTFTIHLAHAPRDAAVSRRAGRATFGVMSRPDSIPGLDIVGHDVYERGVPFAAYDEFRRTAPVAWVNETADNGHAGSGFWSLTAHEHVVGVHKDWRTFSSEIGGTEIEELAPDALEARRTMLETDPPRHTKLRQLVNPTFSRMAVATYAEHSERLVAGVLDAALAKGECDGVYDVARELPIRMITGLLGVPDEDAPQLFHWADQIVYNADPDYSPAVSDQVDTDPYRLLPFRSPVSLKVLEYVGRLAAARRGVAGGDVLTVLANALVDGEPLSEREQGTFFLLLLIAGNETTRHSLSHGLLAFAEHPEALRQLRQRPDLLDTATEEVLRWTSPQLHFRRTATVDTTIGGVPVRAGEKVVTWYMAANFDPDVFPDPSTFDLSRTPNRHVTFGGGGPHLCLGQWMARLEVRTFLEALVERVDRVELTGEPRRVRSNFINGLKALPIALVPR